MDHETRKEFEQYCALAELEDTLEQFVEIKRNIVRLLDDKEVLLRRQPPDRVVFPAIPTKIA